MWQTKQISGHRMVRGMWELGFMLALCSHSFLRGILYPVSGQNVETVLSRQWHSLLVVGKTIQAGGAGTIV